VSDKTRPWTLATVRGCVETAYTRGTQDGLPVFSYGTANRAVWATREQLKQAGLRPGGQDPAALLWFRNRTNCKWVYAALYVIAEAKPRFPMTPAKYRAIQKACAARRVCPDCREDGGDYICPSVGVCEACQYRHGLWEPEDHRHDLVRGTPTLTVAETRELADQDAAAAAALWNTPAAA
jgi:hypothetical protein